MKRPKLKKTSKDMSAASELSSWAYYGALNIINRRRAAEGLPLHDIPEQYRFPNHPLGKLAVPAPPEPRSKQADAVPVAVVSPRQTLRRGDTVKLKSSGVQYVFFRFKKDGMLILDPVAADGERIIVNPTDIDH